MPTTQTKTNTKTVGGKSNKKPTTTTTKTGGAKTVSTSQTTGGKRSARGTRIASIPNDVLNPYGNCINSLSYRRVLPHCLQWTRTAYDCVSPGYKGKTPQGKKPKRICKKVDYVSCYNTNVQRGVSGFGTCDLKTCNPNEGRIHPLRLNTPVAANIPLSAPSGHIHNRPEKVANGNRKTRKPMNRRK